ncbi:TetR/AcrR family transcriptional regulator [Rhodococcus sp. 14C212]|uniref:TetR/AcrR family transcriptional regulator n=1 Tax=Rhodococcus sp. 14C212 TaxID=2711209 RepID=UPI0013EBE72B|nr:TetR/AcrR family transcriptional regulator [Rhodococcus sp. 14C212]NGP06748.1 TetR/AcrR family transcriptional regulator [Rhodococcus sp. 14C212]
MRPTSHRSVRAAQRSAEVLDAAAAVLARQGYDGTSVDAIADELGATKGVIYHYYRSKADILLGVLEAGFQHLMADVAPIAARSDVPADERLYEMCLAHSRAMMNHHSYQVVSIRNIEQNIGHRDGRQEGQWSKIVARRGEYEQLFVRVVSEGCDDGIFKTADPRLTTRALLGALNWIAVWFDPAADPHGKATPAEISEHISRFVVAGAHGLPDWPAS